MKLYPQLFIIIILVGISNKSIAQDPYFSQFYNNRIYLNPAYAGLDRDWTVSLNHRDQWAGVPDGDFNTLNASLRTSMLSGELQLPCVLQNDQLNFGAAISLFHDRAGGAPLETTGLSWAFSYEVANIVGNKKRKKRKKKTQNEMDEERERDKERELNNKRPKNRKKKYKYRRELTRLDLRTGFQVSSLWRRLSGNYLIYSEQLDPVVAPTPLPGSMEFSNDGLINLGAGVMLRGEFGKRLSPMLFTIGIAGANLLEPNQSIESELGSDALPRRYTLHLGFTYRLNTGSTTRAPIDLAPQFRWDTQLKGRLNGQTLGGYILSKGYYWGMFLQYNFPRFRDPSNRAGSFLDKNTTTLIFNLGGDIFTLTDHGKPWKQKRSGFIVGISYDVNVAGLRSNDTLGTLELNLRWNFKRKRSKARCGEIGRFELYDGDCPVKF